MRCNNDKISSHTPNPSARSIVATLTASVALSFAALTALGQAAEQARVPTSYANVHAAPSSGSVLLVLVPQDTMLPIIGRRGEWVQVQLSPELRDPGMVMRWYQGRHDIVVRGEPTTIGGETSGWMHDSTVEISPVESR